MELTAIKEMIKKNNGEHLYPIFVPSLQKEVLFAPLSAGQMKSLAKINIEFDSDISIIHQARLAVIEEISDESIDINTLSDLDYVTILAGLRSNNFVDPLKIGITCKNEVEVIDEETHEITLVTCDHTISTTINTDIIDTNVRILEPTQNITIEASVNGIDYKVVVGRPYIINLIELTMYISNLDKDKQIGALYTRNIIQYIKEVYVNGSSIGDFSIIPFDIKLDIMDNILPAEMLYGENDSIKNTVYDKIGTIDVGALFQTIICPKCKDRKVGLITVDDFFTL